MEFIERIEISLIQKLNRMTENDFENYYINFSDDIEKIKKKDLKSLYEKIMCFCKINIKNNGITKRIYNYSIETIKEKGGRLYCGNSIQGLPKFIRGFLMKHTTDIDAKNCHPTILRYLCKIHNIECPKLDFYIENRDIIINMGTAKKDDYLKSINDGNINKKIKDIFFNDFDKEIKQIHKKIMVIEEYNDIIMSVPKDKKEYNWNGSSLNRILCMYENNILKEVIYILEKLNIEIAVLMFDGLMIYGNYYNDNNLLLKIKEGIEKKFNGLGMEWIYKKHCDKLIIENLNESITDISYNFLPNYIKKIIDSPSECIIAESMKELYGNHYYYIDPDKKRWIEYKNNLWIDSIFGMRPLIDTVFYDEIKKYIEIFDEKINNYDKTYNQQDIIKKREILFDISRRLQKTIDKNNISKELAEKCVNINFMMDMNKEKYILPIKNGKIINLKTLKIDNRNELYKFNYECNVNYIELDEENEKIAKKYFMDLFCNNEYIVKCVINIIKSAITGEKLRYIFFCTGTGRNGKSLLFKLLKLMLNNSIDIISENIIINSKNLKSNINTEIEKLDKIRIGYVTELKEEDTLNSEMIKKISGGDDIDLRSLHKTNTTLTPTCNLFVLTNELPKFKIEEAIIDRIVVIPFKNKFEINTSYEYDIISKIDIIFSYILKYGVISDKFNFPDEMLEAKKDYIEDNDINYLKDFIESEIVFCSDKIIKRDDFRKIYNDWCKVMSYPIDKRSDRSFSREMKKNNIENSSSHGIRVYKNIDFKHD